jgi:leucyl-tRNA synthetase
VGGNYDPQTIEPRWQRAWAEAGLHHVDLDHPAQAFYNLVEFPYPSSEGLHVGHFYSYAGADTYGRYQRMRGYDVFQPMGFDAFGIHAENYALKCGINPAVLVPQNVRRYREEQLKRMGAAFDWSCEVNTTDPRYYRWTQWIFVQLYRGGLAYRATAPVNWCPSCLTTLADEQVIDGHCERCETLVTRCMLTQWFFRITAYAEQLLDFSGADWPETTRRLQTHWIGRTEGAEIHFPIADGGELHEPLTVFSTRPETLYGATFVVLAPEHPDAIAMSAPECRSAVEAYVQQVAGRNVLDRMALDRTRTGVDTGAWALNPVDGNRLPIWVADYVLPGHGSGAIFATPAHDQRDMDLARAYNLPIRTVVCPSEGGALAAGAGAGALMETAYEGDGIMVCSGPYDGMTVARARQAIVADLQAHGAGRPAVSYRLRDWLISRQRYWGPPIPLVYCNRCGEVPVPEEQLPVVLPAIEDFRPLGTGRSPLASLPGFAQTTCPCCGQAAMRETDVSDNFLDSAWYFLRYVSTEYDDRPWSGDRLRRWLPVDMYVGGIEHSTLHHLYARFLWKALQDLGHIPRDLVHNQVTLSATARCDS